MSGLAPSPTLSEICTTSPIANYLKFLIGSGMAITLRRVNKHWGALAIATPLLWECPLTVQITSRLPVAGADEREIAHLGRLSNLEILDIREWWDGMDNVFNIAPRFTTIVFSSIVDILAVNFPRTQISSLRGRTRRLTPLSRIYTQISRMLAATAGPIFTTNGAVCPGFAAGKSGPSTQRRANTKRSTAPGYTGWRPCTSGGPPRVLTSLITCHSSPSSKPPDHYSLLAQRMVQFLDAVSALGTLILRGGKPMTVTDKLLDALAARPDDKPVYFPKLTALHLDGVYLFHDSALYQMLRTRASPGAVATRLEILGITIPNRAVAPVDV
ncbi:hypothetical protein DFH09DRAFT_1085786 [Mycena vulgaris]|nr:hypothetical protein DFH09DRAFT_1085786 [Mycena vulgaris]